MWYDKFFKRAHCSVNLSLVRYGLRTRADVVPSAASQAHVHNVAGNAKNVTSHAEP